MMNNSEFSIRNSGDGYELLDASGDVIAWALDRIWALKILVALEADHERHSIRSGREGRRPRRPEEKSKAPSDPCCRSAAAGDVGAASGTSSLAKGTP